MVVFRRRRRKRALGWLHFSDFHMGGELRSNLWPDAEDPFYNDLKEQHQHSGPWDLVLVTGNITQKGEHDGYAAFDKRMKRLWTYLRGISPTGSPPKIFVVPGNHDLKRPCKSDALKLAGLWEENQTIREQTIFKSEPTGEKLHKIVTAAFANFSSWLENHTHPRIEGGALGVFPGDCSVVFEKRGLRVGLVGLNSSFLHLRAGMCGKLAIEFEQFRKVCSSDETLNWIENNHFNLLLTHHSPAWLSERTQDVFDRKIAPPGRFALHLFGHRLDTSKPNYEKVSTDGTLHPRRQLQAYSLFGRHEDPQRQYGYIAGRIETTDLRTAELRLWPRVIIKPPKNRLKFVPDHRWDLDSDGGTPSETIDLNRVPAGSLRRRLLMGVAVVGAGIGSCVVGPLCSHGTLPLDGRDSVSDAQDKAPDAQDTSAQDDTNSHAQDEAPDAQDTSAEDDINSHAQDKAPDTQENPLDAPDTDPSPPADPPRERPATSRKKVPASSSSLPSGSPSTGYEPPEATSTPLATKVNRTNSEHVTKFKYICIASFAMHPTKSIKYLSVTNPVGNDELCRLCKKALEETCEGKKCTYRLASSKGNTKNSCK